MSSEFESRIAVVTGAGSGIGLKVAELLHEAGSKVFGLDLSEGQMGSVATFVKCDISSDESVQQAFAQIKASTDVIDLLINNAGIGAAGSVEQATTEEWLKVLNVNVIGTSRVSAAALPFLRKSNAASITNTCSIAATAGLPNRAIYSASKGAVLSLTLAMAADFIKEKIRVNCVNPGTADTPWVARLLEKATDPVAEKAALEARQPSGRLVSAEEVARSILFLASPNQSAITGTALAVYVGMQGLRLPK
jgi:NAD(P)-dependent dehydrogenase (short-subunit alcohol dehydrogenase family)